MNQRHSKTFDVIIWGATGFTGRLVSEYFARHAPSSIRFGLAGRNHEKLKEVRETITKINPLLEDIPLLVGDVQDPTSIDNIVKKTRVICSTVGPYAQYGPPIVDACCRFQTDYCDITGEPNYIRFLIDKYHKKASEEGVMIVPSCGFDSIPSDLGSFMVAKYMKEKLNRNADKITCYFGSSRGGVSGGTVASLMGVLDLPLKEHIKMADSYYLNPENSKRGKDKDPVFIGYEKELKRWRTPWVMGSINSRVVRRSIALSDYSFGNFSYSEYMTVKGFISAVFMFMFYWSLTLLIIRPVRQILKRFLPKPGEGPSKEIISTGFFNMNVLGWTKPEAQGEKKQKVVGIVKGVQDPGYGETSKMLAESAICLALERDKLPFKGGVLTPSTAMGHKLIDRLNAAGMTFKIDESS